MSAPPPSPSPPPPSPPAPIEPNFYGGCPPASHPPHTHPHTHARCCSAPAYRGSNVPIPAGSRLAGDVSSLNAAVPMHARAPTHVHCIVVTPAYHFPAPSPAGVSTAVIRSPLQRPSGLIYAPDSNTVPVRGLAELGSQQQWLCARAMRPLACSGPEPAAGPVVPDLGWTHPAFFRSAPCAR